MLLATPFLLTQAFSSASIRLHFFPLVFLLSCCLFLLSVFFLCLSLQCWRRSSGSALGAFLSLSTYSFCKISTTPKPLITTHMLMDPKSRIPVQISEVILSCKSVCPIAFWLFPSGDVLGASNSTLPNQTHNFSHLFLPILVNGTTWLLKSKTWDPALTPLSLTTPIKWISLS